MRPERQRLVDLNDAAAAWIDACKRDIEKAAASKQNHSFYQPLLDRLKRAEQLFDYTRSVCIQDRKENPED